MYKLVFVYKMVDICVGEFVLEIFYYYGIYEFENESIVMKCLFVLVLGLGLICIG